MKKFIITLIIGAAISLGVSASAAELGYIMELSDNAPILLMDTDENLKALDDNGDYFYAEDMSDLMPYLSYAKNICRDFELELFDYPETTNDASFSLQWNHPVIKAEAVRRAGLDGSGVKIGIIDSGLNIYHEDIDTDNIFYTYDCISKTETLANINDTYGHGSFTIGTMSARTNNSLGIAGISDKTQLAVIRVTDGKTLTASDLITSTEKLIDQKCDIINMSLGAPASALSTDQMSTFSSLIDRAYNNGIIIVAAVGNNSNTTLNYPAAFDKVIGVGSVDKLLNRSSFSNYNESVFVAAPGSSLYGLNMNGTNSYKIWSGTSFSTPQVTAAAAIAKQVWSDMSFEDFQQLLIDTSTDLGTAGYDVNFGYGLLNFEAIINELSPLIPTPAPTETAIPSATPTVAPSATPTVTPTATPTVAPTGMPTATPTVTPTAAPTGMPTATPTAAPTATPTVTPSISPFPTIEPLEEYKGRIRIEKYISDDNLHIILNPLSDIDMTKFMLINAQYNNGRLESVHIDNSNVDYGSVEFSVKPEENSMIYLWDGYGIPISARIW